jgi:hypothetical protein
MRLDGHYQSLLESLADGVAIDWAAIDVGAASEIDRRRYRNLRLVARVAALYRTILGEDPAARVPSGAWRGAARSIDESHPSAGRWLGANHARLPLLSTLQRVTDVAGS